MNPLAQSRDVYDITAFTALDFPDHLAAILWFAGCNLACAYCYNPHIVNGAGRYTASEVLEFLRSRVGFLEGVVLSGGEATTCKNLHFYAQEAKNLNYKIKLDTNGTNPMAISNLLPLLDFVSLDFKATSDKWQLVTGNKKGYEDFVKSFEILQNSGIEFEVRTTLHSDQLSAGDIEKMADFLTQKGYKKPLFVQEYREATTLGNIGKSVKIDLSHIRDVVIR